MSFTTKEFSGRVFESLEELEAAQKEQEEIKRRLISGTTVVVEKVDKTAEEIGGQVQGE